ncbi:MAG: hypothetical protein HY747_01355 [Elusimicrobia bacterium]|nr:hypothetical protein [Elusimicrobiota bacterium]
MTEQIIHGILLALHNIALVGCAAAPFYNRNLVATRAQYGPKLHYELDKVVEETLQGNAPYCMAFIAALFATGIAMPLNHYLFHGAFRVLHPAAWAAIGLKLTAVFGMMVIMGQIFLGLNPRLRELFATFAADKAPDIQAEKEFFEKRARRKALCETCLKLAVAVLVCSAFIGFNPQ